MKTWTTDEIRELILTNNVAMMRGLIAIYNRQTEDEKSAECTTHNNGRGFNGADAKILTSIVKFYFERHYISDKQKAIVRKKLMKYVGQLTKIANKE